MTDLSELAAAIATPDPDPEPTKPAKEPARTGEHDPFAPLDPEDPFGVTRSRDPLAPDKPDPDPTTNGGVEIPPPPVVPPGQPPPGYAALKSTVASLPDPPNPKEPADAAKLRVLRIAKEGRYSLSDHWGMVKRMSLARGQMSVGHAQDPQAEQNNLNDLTKVLASDGNVTTALNDWSAARAVTPMDLARLATAAESVKDAIASLQAELEKNKRLAKGVDEQWQLLAGTLPGFVAQVGSECRKALDGTRMSRGSAGDVPTFHLESATRDQTWAGRLEACGTWGEIGNMLTTTIGKEQLKLPVSRASGILDFSSLTAQLKALDTAVRDRDKSPTGPTDVLRSFLGVANELNTRLQTVQDRQIELSKPPAPRGWDAGQVQSARDLLAGVARVLQNELASDPLLEDPNLAAAAKNALAQIGPLAAQTSLEDRVTAAGRDLRKVWRNAKTRELKALQKAEVDLGDLPGMFSQKDQGLGPLLDKWSKEVGKFPGHDRAKVKDYAAQIAVRLQTYRSAINQQLGPARSSGLVEGLDIVAGALTRQIRSFDSRGGLFG
jgi:hypothetical protein